MRPQRTNVFSNCHSDTSSSPPLVTLALLMACITLASPDISLADNTAADPILIVHYSRTGKSKLVSDTLAKYLKADVIALTDMKDRSGAWGYFTAFVDTFFENHTTIEPAQTDLSAYSDIILISPVWGSKLSVATRTFLHNHRLRGKKLLLFTTANIDLNKYEIYDDNASFIKRYLRDFMREKRDKMHATTAASGAEIIDHYHIATKNVSAVQIEKETEKLICKGQQELSWQVINQLNCP